MLFQLWKGIKYDDKVLLIVKKSYIFLLSYKFRVWAFFVSFGFCLFVLFFYFCFYFLTGREQA